MRSFLKSAYSTVKDLQERLDQTFDEALRGETNNTNGSNNSIKTSVTSSLCRSDFGFIDNSINLSLPGISNLFAQSTDSSNVYPLGEGPHSPFQIPVVDSASELSQHAPLSDVDLNDPNLISYNREQSDSLKPPYSCQLESHEALPITPMTMMLPRTPIQPSSLSHASTCNAEEPSAGFDRMLRIDKRRLSNLTKEVSDIGGEIYEKGLVSESIRQRFSYTEKITAEHQLHESILAAHQPVIPLPKVEQVRFADAGVRNFGSRH